MVRAVRPTDLVTLLALRAHSAAPELAALVWLRARWGAGLYGRLPLVAQALLHPLSQRSALVATNRGRIQALAIARPRARGLAWEVERFVALPSALDAGRQLLDYLALQAAGSGARRVFFRTPAGSFGMELARKAGFEHYASSRLYAHSSSADEGAPPPVRPRLREDDFALFRLYNAAVPSRVRAAEAMTFEEWAALYSCPRSWSPALLEAREHYVFEQDGALGGWLELRSGLSGGHLSMLLHPDCDGVTDEVLHFARGRAKSRAPLQVSVWDYQPLLASALERNGFQAVGEFDCHVRLLARRVTEPRLVPAKMVGGC